MILLYSLFRKLKELENNCRLKDDEILALNNKLKDKDAKLKNRQSQVKISLIDGEDLIKTALMKTFLIRMKKHMQRNRKQKSQKSGNNFTRVI